ncbi:Glucokinase [Novipirellula galeiformis]|uniref:Glucokinase n=1 Tax=Novipirellula galeiformis TaxID=2528004 RepID=A0A5C6C0D2_9BACT|nr:ROK family protein [Novipirellula galeiformis]TWU17655.1 Glucokinase [Novipirellula galeiformis]
MPVSDPAPLYLGIDVGGTDVKLGLVDGECRIVDSDRTATSTLKTPQNVFQHAVEFVGNRPIAAVGLAVPGVLDTRAYVLREVVNLEGWLGVPLRDELARITRLPSIVVNDANAAAYAEHALRSLGGQSLALVTLGTGVGCGMVVGGDPHGGDHGCAGELGHIAIDFSAEALPCTCGSRGHLETYAGASGVIARMIAASGEDAGAITPLKIASRAERGDVICQNVISETAVYVGRAIGMMGQVADPAVVLLGGAMTFGGSETKTGLQFLEQIRHSVKETTLVQVGGNMKIEFATLGNQAGMIGAAMVARDLL